MDRQQLSLSTRCEIEGRIPASTTFLPGLLATADEVIK
jgi:hypothetical protein